jgi:hypothetical protein
VTPPDDIFLQTPPDQAPLNSRLFVGADTISDFSFHGFDIGVGMYYNDPNGTRHDLTSNALIAECSSRANTTNGGIGTSFSVTQVGRFD